MALQLPVSYNLDECFTPKILDHFVIRPGIRLLLNWIAREYNNVEVVITENGLGTAEAGTNDTDRVQYYQEYLEEILKAIELDGNKVTGYLAWSLLGKKFFEFLS